jgi:phenylacetate-CoA ligase
VFGLPFYHGYGVHEIQWLAVECTARGGLHIMEDAFIAQVVHPETGEPVPDGETGMLLITELYKTGSPQIRYNSLDMTFLYPREQCACGSWLRRMGPFGGRGDNMVKLRGVMVWPEAVGDIVTAIPGGSTDYFVWAYRENNRDEMKVSVCSPNDPAEYPEIAAAMEQALMTALGVRIRVDIVRPGELDEYTEIETSPKAKHFRDLRAKEERTR